VAAAAEAGRLHPGQRPHTSEGEDGGDDPGHRRQEQGPAGPEGDNPPQRRPGPGQEALSFLIGKVYPVKWKDVKTDTAEITWEMKEGGAAHAKCGDKGEVTLEPAMVDGKQTVVLPLKYWGAQKNNGFALCYGTHWYKGNGYDYKYTKQNGFSIHIESSGEEEMKK
jgi:hypothetical protein